MNQTEKDMKYLAELCPWLKSFKVYYPPRVKLDDLIEEKAINTKLKRTKNGLKKFI